MGNCFWCYFRQVYLHVSLAFRKCKKDCSILRIIMVPGFCLQKRLVFSSNGAIVRTIERVVRELMTK